MNVVLFLLGLFFLADNVLADNQAEDFFKSKEAIELIQFIENSDLNAIRKYSEKGGDLDIQGLRGATPISWAIVHGKEGVVDLLLELGVDFNYDNEFGRTPLAAAALNNKKKLVKTLLAMGANPNIEYNVGVRKPLFAELLINDNEAMAGYLLNHGADINYQISRSNETAIMIFYSIGDWDKIYWLLEADADPYIEDAFGYDLNKAISRILAGKRKVSFFQKKWFKRVQNIMDIMNQEAVQNNN